MTRFLLLLFLLSRLILPVQALEITAPQVPDSGSAWMPEDTSSFSDGLIRLLTKAVSSLNPDIEEALQISLTTACIILLFSVLRCCSPSVRKTASIGGSALICVTLLQNTQTLIRLGSATITELSSYGKLLLPVMTAALAGQGGGTTAAALYAGTAALDLILTSLISHILLPAVYFFLAMAAANSALGENSLKQLRDFVKWLISWTLKTLLMIYTTYMSITGVISGTTDAVALKAAKFTISNVVPVVGGILSDASEAVLVSAGLMKNAAGIYGILAMLAVFLVPFLRIGIHYGVLKLTAAVTSLYGPRELTTLVEDFAAAMGLLLAMTGATCLLQLVSTICFLKGVG